MYLSRLILNPRRREVRRDLGDCHELHRTVMSAFPSLPATGDARAALGVLHRTDAQPAAGVVTLLVQSKAPPDWSQLSPGYTLDTGGVVENPACKQVDGYYRAVRTGDILRFRLRANPTRKVDTKSGPDGKRRNGKRVELRDEAAQLDWLRRKGRDGGFVLLRVRTDRCVPDVRTAPTIKVTGKRTRGQAPALVFGAVLFEGMLRVTDAEHFRRSIEQGIGPGKSYGFGLLSVGRVAQQSA